jgi:hypothetical protein
VVTGEWRRLHNEELYNHYNSKCYFGNQIKKNDLGVLFTMCGREKKCIHGFDGDAEERNQLS